ncbi:hypothetical protein BGW39_000584, partial [Mortierella sp. 14UC]
IPISRNEPAQGTVDSRRLWYSTLRKYGLARTKSEMETKGVSALPLVDYYGLLDIGTPPQRVKMQFDTGSSRFVISMTECPDCSGNAPFNRALSSTFREGVAPWKIQYGDRSFAAGNIAEDKVTLGAISVENQKLNLVLTESPNFDDTVDGVLGLSFGAISGSTTVFESMTQQGLVDQGIFSFFTGKRSVNGGGEVVFGGLDMERVEPGNNITYTSVTEATHWNIDVQDFTMNGGSFATEKRAASIRSIVDTGTTLARKFRKVWVAPCKASYKLGVVVEGKMFSVPYEDLAREYVGFGLCFSAVQTSSADYLILGDVFLKSNYAVFDQAEKCVGFAPLRTDVKRATTTDSEDEDTASGRVQREL